MIGIIITTTECNLSCSYCYEHQKRNLCRKSRTQINSYFENSLSNLKTLALYISICSRARGRRGEIILHGGEPLLVSLENLLELIEYIDSLENLCIQIQTNATLITEEHIQLFKKFNVTVSVSIDGPKYLHDKYRVSSNSKPSFDAVYKNIKKLQKNNIPVIAFVTVTDCMIDKARDVFDFFQKNALSFSVNRCFEDLSHTNQQGSIDEREYKKFLFELYDLYNSNKNIRISCFDRCEYELKKSTNGYIYKPLAAEPFLIVGKCEKNDYEVINCAASQKNKDLDEVYNILKYSIIDSHGEVAFVGTKKKCIIDLLCYQEKESFLFAKKTTD